MQNKRYYINGFTLVEMMSIILISSISFLGMFYIYTDVSNKFENDFSNYIKKKNVFAVSSAAAALEIIALLLNLNSLTQI